MYDKDVNVGNIAGTITSASTGLALSGVEVSLNSSPVATTTITGTYSAGVPAGTYTMYLRKYGYQIKTASVVVTKDSTTTTNLTMTLL